MTFPHWLQVAIGQYGYWVVLVAVALESMGVPFPGETALILGAVYAGAEHRFSIALVIAAAAAGAILGDNTGFAIGHFGGRPLLRRLTGVRFLRLVGLNDRNLDRAQRFFDRHGPKTVFFGRFFSLLRAWAAFLAGANRMHWRTFLLWNALGGILWAIIYGLLGYFLGNNLPLLGRVVGALGVGGVALFVAVVGGAITFWFIRRRRQRQRPEDAAHELDSPPASARSAPPQPGAPTDGATTRVTVYRPRARRQRGRAPSPGAPTRGRPRRR